ncbi:MAG: elongation factor P [Synergistaceae bacterium]|jgi:elongation factor P|nr:elongation factor P [Synergistaceae bacterium]
MAQVVDTTDFYVGLKFRWQEGIWEIVEFDHHKMGRGGAVVRTKLRNVETGSAVENSFKPGEKFERIIYDEKPAQFSYKDGGDYVFMDLATYDELRVSPNALGDAVKYLVDNMEIKIEVFEEKIMGVELPKSVILKVENTPPSFKGDTVSGGGKPAELETGITVTVPVFIESGEYVVVDTRTGQYLERAKK